MTKPSLPQGTRDFSPETVRKRNYIFSIIRDCFERYGFQPLETPAMENLDTLMGKYGEEGDRLIFKILNNGLNDPKNLEKANAGFEKVLEGKHSSLITERALKYDLTIPFARYVAMNHGALSFPFKRYQIQPVWRADRPQKGRYREFTQCDADVVGSQSLLNEVELVHIYHDVFTTLGIKDYQLKINNRKILAGLAALCGDANKLTDITIAIDKLDKIGLEKVKAELTQKGLSETQIATISAFLSISGSNDEKIKQLETLLTSQESALQGIREIFTVLKQCEGLNITLDCTLARGLNYYTGCIYEVKAPENIQIGSIGGGGRYDDLTGLFGVPDIPGVGISFGVDRIYDVMEEMQLFPENLLQGCQAIFMNMGDAFTAANYQLMQGLRRQGISCEMYHEPTKLDKQFKYADRKKIRFAIIMGSNEMEEGVCMLKNLITGEQTKVKPSALGELLK